MKIVQKIGVKKIAAVLAILVLLFMIWFVQMLFGIKVNVPKDMPKKNTK